MMEINMKRLREEMLKQVDPKKQKMNNTSKQQDYTFEGLIKIVKDGDRAGAEKLILQMDQQELKKVDQGKTVLHLAAEKGNKEVCEVILDKCPEAINAVTEVYKGSVKTADSGKTALHLAAEKGNKEVCEVLLECMAIVEKQHYIGLLKKGIKKFVR
jgi:hypothetical protein